MAEQEISGKVFRFLSAMHPSLSKAERKKIRQEYNQLKGIDKRAPLAENPKLLDFWEHWRAHYGDSGLKNPRGDRLLTELAVRSMARLQPRMMVSHARVPSPRTGLMSA